MNKSSENALSLVEIGMGREKVEAFQDCWEKHTQMSAVGANGQWEASSFNVNILRVHFTQFLNHQKCGLTPQACGFGRLANTQSLMPYPVYVSMTHLSGTSIFYYQPTRVPGEEE